MRIVTTLGDRDGIDNSVYNVTLFRQTGRLIPEEFSHKVFNRLLTLTTNTGHFTLFVDVRTNFVVTAFIGLFNIPIGGTSCTHKKMSF